MVIKSSQSVEVFSKLEVFRASGDFVCAQTDDSSGLWSSSSWHGCLRHVCPLWYEESRRDRREISASPFIDEEMKSKVMKSTCSLNPWQN